MKPVYSVLGFEFLSGIWLLNNRISETEFTIISDVVPNVSSFLFFQGAYKHHKEVRAAQGVKIVARVSFISIAMPYECWNPLSKNSLLICISSGTSICNGWHFSHCSEARG